MGQLEREPLKKHGDELEGTIQNSGNAGTNTNKAASTEKRPDPIPVPENGSHDKSHAAHLGHVHEQTKPADKLKQGMGSNTLREPPMVVSRVGKQNRG